MADPIAPPKKGLVRGLLGGKVPATKKKEQEIESSSKWKKVFGYLEGYKKSFALLTMKQKEKGGIWDTIKGMFGAIGGGLKGLMGKILGVLGLTGIFTKVAGLGLGAALLPAAIILWGLTSVFKIVDKWTEGFKADGFAGGFASALGNKAEGGAMSAVGGALTWAGIGATAGIAFGPLGMLVGGLIGAAIGGFFGWLGSEKIKKGIQKVQDFFGFPDLMTDKEKEEHQAKIDAITLKIKALKSDVIPVIESEIQVYTDMQEKGTELTLEEMKALDKLYEEKKAAERAILDAEKEMAVLKRDLERQKLANLNQEKAELNKTKFALTHQLTQVGDTGFMVHGEITALMQEIRLLDKDIKNAEKKGLTTEVASLKNKKRIAQAQLKLKQDMKIKVDAALDKTADEIFEEQKRLKELDMLSWWESRVFGVKSWSRDFKEGWGFLMSDLGAMAKSVGGWIYTPGGTETGPPGTGALSKAKIFGMTLEWPSGMAKWGREFKEGWNFLMGDLGSIAGMIGNWIYTPGGRIHPDHPEKSKAKLFGMTLEWPSWMSSVGTTLSDAWDSTMEWFGTLPKMIGNWIYTPGGRETGPPGTGAVTAAKIFGVQLPPLPAIGDALTEAWDKITGWVKGLGLWFWNKEQGTMFGNFKIPTFEIPSIEWDAIVGGLMGKAASVIGKIPFIDRVPGMASFLKKWGGDDRPSGPTQADAMPPAAKVDSATGISESGQAQLQTHEGFRGTAYDDTEGVRTIGYGFNLDRTYAKTRFQDSLPGLSFADVKSGKVSITEDQAKKLMLRDLKDAKKDASRFVGVEVWETLNQDMKDVLVNMAYNLGASRLKGFKDLRSALKKDTGPDYEAASKAMLDSKWAEQVKGRATDLAAIASAIGNSRPHLVTDIGLLIKEHGFLPIKISAPDIVPVPSGTQRGAMLNALELLAGNRGGTTVINNTSMIAPSSSNVISSQSITEQTYGTSDPFTSVSGAYG